MAAKNKSKAKLDNRSIWNSVENTLLMYLRTWLSTLVSCYMLLIICGMPFYFTDGYGRIGTNKYEFFYTATKNVGLIMLPFLLLYAGLWIYQECSGKRLLKTIKEQISVTDIFALVYAVAVIFSYLFSDYKADEHGNAWKGADGWYMGFVTQMFFVGIYFAVSKLWKPQKWIVFLIIPVSFCVYILGYLNRFGVYPIDMQYSNAEFISTIGNINWYCGYVITIFFGAVYYWWADSGNKKWLNWVLPLYILVGFATLITQGSNSGMLVLFTVMIVMYLLSCRDGQRMQKFWLLCSLLGFAGTISWLLRLCAPDSLNYQDFLVDLFTNSPLPVAIFVLSAAMYLFLNWWNRRRTYPERFFRVVGLAGAAVTALGIGALIVAMILNTLFPGCLGSLSGLSFLTFDWTWGSNRGLTFKAGFYTWLDQDLIGKIFGIGPDCMARYVHSGELPEILAKVQEFYGMNTRLTNAHNEWLTILVNEGILGAAGFVGMMASAIVRYLKSGRENVIAGACGLCLLAYTVNNMVSFQQAMSTSAMFLVLGIGAAFLRKAPENPKS